MIHPLIGIEKIKASSDCIEIAMNSDFDGIYFYQYWARGILNNTKLLSDSEIKYAVSPLIVSPNDIEFENKVKKIIEENKVLENQGLSVPQSRIVEMKQVYKYELEFRDFNDKHKQSNSSEMQIFNINIEKTISEQCNSININELFEKKLSIDDEYYFVISGSIQSERSLIYLFNLPELKSILSINSFGDIIDIANSSNPIDLTPRNEAVNEPSNNSTNILVPIIILFLVLLALLISFRRRLLATLKNLMRRYVRSNNE